MEIRINQVKRKEQVLELLFKYDKSFVETISGRVGSLDQYAEKLFRLAQTYTISFDEMQVGAISFYANDTEERAAYLTMIAVDPAYQSKGIGSRLLQHCEDKSKELGMKQLRLEVDKRNTNAILFYQSKGFTYYDEASGNTIHMTKELY